MIFIFKKYFCPGKACFCRNKSRLCLSLIIGLVLTGMIMQYISSVKADIEKSCVRLHVIANSNSPEDQQLKLSVRNAVLKHLEEKLKNAQTTGETKQIIQNELDSIAQAAQEELILHGARYRVTAELGNFNFPTKQYEGAKLPAGNYDALRIIIGAGEGENWWCVLYPQLCFTGAYTAKLPEESRQKLKNVLTEDEYNIITSPSDCIPVKIKFRLLELFGS